MLLASKALIRGYGDFQCPVESSKSLPRMLDALTFYYEHYPLDREPAEPILLADGRRAIEFSFAEPLDSLHPVTCEPLQYVGRMDAITNYAGGVFVTDEKTTKYLGDEWGGKWHLRSQFTGYCWGAKRSGLHVDGVLVRGISILKTKCDTQQAISYRPQWQVDRWYDELLTQLSDMITAWHRMRSGAKVAFYFNLDDGCTTYGKCPFTTVCQSQDQMPWLKQSFERKIWNPVTREETLIPEPERVVLQLEIETDLPRGMSREQMLAKLRDAPTETFNQHCEGPFEARVVSPESKAVELPLPVDASEGDILRSGILDTLVP